MSQPSGKFVLRIDPHLHQSLRNAANDSQLSLNAWIVRQLQTTSHVSPKILEILKATFAGELLGVVQFGSSVRGEMRANSDIDLLIVLADSRNIDRSLYHLWDQITAMAEMKVYSPQFTHLPKIKSCSSLWLEVAIEGEIIYDPGRLVGAAIRQIREAVAGGFYYRKMSHGHPYWVQKVDDAK